MDLIKLIDMSSNKNKNKSQKAKYLRQYKRNLVNLRHPKETSIPDPDIVKKINKYLPHQDPELDVQEQEIIELERAYGFGSRFDSFGNIITGSGKRIIGRHYET
jgi:hypothetical protein